MDVFTHPYTRLALLQQQANYSPYGVKDRCLEFDGTAQVNCGSGASLDNLSIITLEAWIYLDSYGIPNSGHIIAKGEMSSAGYRMVLRGGLTNFAYSEVLATGFKLWNPPSGLLSLDTWYHIAVSRDRSLDANDAVFFVNGVQYATDSYLGTGTGAYADDSAKDLYIGNDERDTFYFDGKIDDVRIWNHVRTETQIKQYYKHGLTGKETGLVAYLPFNEGTGSTAYDKSPNGNNGTITGASWVTP